MKFGEFVCSDTIRTELLATDKQGTIREMVKTLLDAGQIEEEHYAPVVNTLLKREKLGSTGMGRGAAIPHAKHPSVNQTVVTIAVSQSGIDFDSLDGEPVFVFFLLISPPDHPNNHIQALAHIAQQLRTDTFCRFLRQAKSVDEIKQLLNESDAI